MIKKSTIVTDIIDLFCKYNLGVWVLTIILIHAMMMHDFKV